MVKKKRDGTAESHTLMKFLATLALSPPQQAKMLDRAGSWFRQLHWKGSRNKRDLLQMLQQPAACMSCVCVCKFTQSWSLKICIEYTRKCWNPLDPTSPNTAKDSVIVKWRIFKVPQLNPDKPWTQYRFRSPTMSTLSSRGKTGKWLRSLNTYIETKLQSTRMQSSKFRLHSLPWLLVVFSSVLFGWWLRCELTIESLYREADNIGIYVYRIIMNYRIIKSMARQICAIMTPIEHWKYNLNGGGFNANFSLVMIYLAVIAYFRWDIWWLLSYCRLVCWNLRANLLKGSCHFMSFRFIVQFSDLAQLKDLISLVFFWISSAIHLHYAVQDEEKIVQRCSKGVKMTSPVY